jgi:hypothetical protein
METAKESSKEMYAFDLDGSKWKADQVDKKDDHPPSCMGTKEGAKHSLGRFENDCQDNPEIIRLLVEGDGRIGSNMSL